MNRIYGFAVCFAAIAAAGLAPGAAPAQTLRDAASACLTTLTESPGVEGAATRPLGELCPAAAELLGDSPWGDALGPFARDSIDPLRFGELAGLAERYAAGPPTRGLDTAALAGVVAELEPFVPPPQLTLWEQFMRWLDERFGSDDDSPGWLAGWLESISLPEWSLEVVLWVLGALVVLGTLAVIVNELRQSGVFAGRAASGSRSAGSRPSERFDRPQSLEQIRRAPPPAQPGLMLAFVLERLRESAAVSFPESATHRELAAAAAGANANWQAPLATISGAAERVTFGRWRPAGSELGPVWTAGERLLASLEPAPGEPA